MFSFFRRTHSVTMTSLRIIKFPAFFICKLHSFSSINFSSYLNIVGKESCAAPASSYHEYQPTSSSPNTCKIYCVEKPRNTKILLKECNPLELKILCFHCLFLRFHPETLRRFYRITSGFSGYIFRLCFSYSRFGDFWFWVISDLILYTLSWCDERLSVFVDGLFGTTCNGKGFNFWGFIKDIWFILLNSREIEDFFSLFLGSVNI